jgi:hypothetical protein
VQRAEALVRQGDGLPASFRLGDVAAHRHYLVALELADRGVHVLGDDASAARGQQLDGRLSDATRGTGDDRHGSCQLAARRIGHRVATLTVCLPV